MAKTISYTTLKLKLNTTVLTFPIGDKEVEVKQYLPISEKYDLISYALLNAQRDGIYDPLQQEKYFYLGIVFCYSNITFTEKQKEDLDALYDILETNDVINNVVGRIPAEEMAFLLNHLEETQKLKTKFFYSVPGSLQTFFTSMAENAELAKETMETMDLDKYTEAIDFAKATGKKK